MRVNSQIPIKEATDPDLRKAVDSQEQAHASREYIPNH